MKTKTMYKDITLVIILYHEGHEYLYFQADGGDDIYYEWQRGSHTINTKAHPRYMSQDLDCFSMCYSTKPSLRTAKSCILDYINER